MMSHTPQRAQRIGLWLPALLLALTLGCAPATNLLSSTPTLPTATTEQPTSTPAPTLTPSPTPTPSPTAAPTQTPRPTPPPEALVPIGHVTPPPEDFRPTAPPPPEMGAEDIDAWIREYVALVTAMLNSAESVSAVLDRLTAWSTPSEEPMGEEEQPPAWAEAADLDGDGADEWLMTLPVPERGCGVTWCPAYTVVLEVDDGLFVPGHVVRGDPSYEVAVHHPQLRQIEDINADGKTEVLVEQRWCGAHTCFTGLTVGRWDGARWHDLADGPINQAYTDLTVEDRNGDGALEFIFRGGMYGSVGAGLQRGTTLVWAWEDGAYRLVEEVPHPSDHPYYLMLDANTALAEGRWDEALDLAEQVVNDPDFEGSMAPVEEVDKRRIVSYAAVEAMLVHAHRGDVAAMEVLLDHVWAHDFMAPNVYTEAAERLLEVYSETGDALAACSAVEELVAAQAEEAVFFQWYGYNTTRMTVNDVCPLDPPREGESPEL